MNLPKVSIVIPFYTKEWFNLDITLESIFNQTYKNIEIIIVDDNSPISTDYCIKKYINEPKIKIIKNSSNVGGGIARNVGINNSSGEYIAFMDHDDKWYDSKIEKQLDKYLEEIQKKPDQNIVIYSKCRVIDSSISYIVPRYAKDENSSVSEYLFLHKGLIQTSGIFLPKKLALTCPFHDLKRHQDYQFCFSLEEANSKFIMIDEPLYDFIQIPKLNDNQFSLTWLEKYNKFFTKKSSIGFKKVIILRTMLRENKYLSGFLYAIKNDFFIDGAKTIFISILKKTLPSSIQQYIQVTIRKRK